MTTKWDLSMKPTPIFVAAAGFAMLGACSVKTEDNATEAADSSSAMATNEGVPSPANDAGADTLGNQLNQLNESDTAAANEAANSSD